MSSKAKVAPELAPLFMPPLVCWWKELNIEHSHLQKQTNTLRTRLDKLDMEIGQCKSRAPAGSKITQAKIERRKRLHQNELEAFEWHLHSVERSLKSFNAALDVAIQKYACVSCHALISALHCTLPRELRDMVYDQLLDPRIVDHVGNKVPCQFAYNDPILTVSYPFVELPHYFDSAFAPNMVRTEMLETAAERFIWPPGFPKLETFARIRALDTDLPASIFFDKQLKFVPPVKIMFEEWKAADARRVGNVMHPEWIEHFGDLLQSIPTRKGRSLELGLSLKKLPIKDQVAFKAALEQVLDEIKSKEFENIKTWCLWGY